MFLLSEDLLSCISGAGDAVTDQTVVLLAELKLSVNKLGQHIKTNNKGNVPLTSMEVIQDNNALENIY